MKKSILEIGIALDKAEQKLVFGGNDPADPGPPGGGNSGGSGNSGNGNTEDCANQATCTHDGDCHNVIFGAPSFCQSGCCITIN